MMNMNVGKIDRIFRILIGIALIASAVTGYFAPWGWIGVVPLITALMGWCPAYAVFGLRTCPISGNHGTEGEA